MGVCSVETVYSCVGWHALRSTSGRATQHRVSTEQWTFLSWRLPGTPVNCLFAESGPDTTLTPTRFPPRRLFMAPRAALGFLLTSGFLVGLLMPRGTASGDPASKES